MNKEKTMRDVRAEQGIDVDACDDAFRKQLAEETLARFDTLDDVSNFAYKMKQEIADVARKRKKEINDAADAPYFDEMKRWKNGNVVYFGIDETFLHMYSGGKSSTCKKAIVYKVTTRGKNPNAWLVVPRDHGNYPGQRYGHPGKTLRNYSLRTIRKHEISRVELDIRKKVGAK